MVYTTGRNIYEPSSFMDKKHAETYIDIKQSLKMCIRALGIEIKEIRKDKNLDEFHKDMYEIVKKYFLEEFEFSKTQGPFYELEIEERVKTSGFKDCVKALKEYLKPR